MPPDPDPDPDPDPPSALVGAAVIHPFAAEQASALGKTVNSLWRVGDRIYAGYGDYNANTGPMRIAWIDAADPQAGFTADPLVVPSEALNVYRHLPNLIASGSGALVAPLIDARNAHDADPDLETAGYAQLVDSASGWDDSMLAVLPRGVHVFDAAEFGGAAWLVGQYDRSANGNAGRAAVWKLDYSDRASGWRIDASIVNGDEFGFFWLGVVGGALVTMQSYLGGQGPFYRHDGTAWAQLALSLPSNSASGVGRPWRDGWLLNDQVPFSGHRLQLLTRSGDLTFDVQDLTPITGAVSGWDVDAAGDLWVLVADRLRRISSAGDLANAAENVATVGLPSGKVASCISVLDATRVAIGTRTAEVYVVTLTG